MHRLSSQYVEHFGSLNQSDFNSMRYWMEKNSIFADVHPYKGEMVNAGIVNSWAQFKSDASNFLHFDFNRPYLENAAREKCDAVDYYELLDTLDELTDRELIIIAQLF